jgi:hypothetical protein
MRMVRVGKSGEAEVPTSWPEAEKMITNALGDYYDTRGKNLARLSIAARAVHGMLGKRYMAAEPTLALLFLVREICARKGMGLDKEPGP